MGGLLLTLFHHPVFITAKILGIVLKEIDRALPWLTPPAISAVFGDPVLAQVGLDYCERITLLLDILIWIFVKHQTQM